MPSTRPLPSGRGLCRCQDGAWHLNCVRGLLGRLPEQQQSDEMAELVRLLTTPDQWSVGPMGDTPEGWMMRPHHQEDG